MSLIDHLQGSPEPSDRSSAVDREVSRLYNRILVRLADLLDEREWTLEDLAGRIGRDVSFVERVLSGEQLTLRALVEFEFVLGDKIIEVPED